MCHLTTEQSLFGAFSSVLKMLDFLQSQQYPGNKITEGTHKSAGIQVFWPPQ